MKPKIHILAVLIVYLALPCLCYSQSKDHAWDPTFAMDELLPWLFSKINKQ